MGSGSSNNKKIGCCCSPACWAVQLQQQSVVEMCGAKCFIAFHLASAFGAMQELC